MSAHNRVIRISQLDFSKPSRNFPARSKFPERSQPSGESDVFCMQAAGKMQLTNSRAKGLSGQYCLPDSLHQVSSAEISIMAMTVCTFFWVKTIAAANFWARGTAGRAYISKVWPVDSRIGVRVASRTLLFLVLWRSTHRHIMLPGGSSLQPSSIRSAFEPGSAQTVVCVSRKPHQQSHAHCANFPAPAVCKGVGPLTCGGF
jgi:hypothetical protein